MKRYLLDSNIWIYAMNGRHPELREKLESLPLDDVYLSDIVAGELAFGWENSTSPATTKRKVDRFLNHFPTPHHRHELTCARVIGVETSLDRKLGRLALCLGLPHDEVIGLVSHRGGGFGLERSAGKFET